MTYDDGILIVYARINTAANGAMPVYSYTEKARYFFSFDVLGFSRYYEAMKAQVQLSQVVNIPDWVDVDVADVVELEDAIKYRVAQVQFMHSDGLKMTKLSLEKIENDI